MVSRAVPSLCRMLVLAVLAVAVTATAFAHRRPAAADPALAFALANGAGVADFCGSVGGGDRAGALHCPACQVTGGADLPPRLPALAALLPARPGTSAPSQLPVSGSPRDPAHGPQGPPRA